MKLLLTVLAGSTLLLIKAGAVSSTTPQPSRFTGTTFATTTEELSKNKNPMAQNQLQVDSDNDGTPDSEDDDDDNDGIKDHLDRDDDGNGIPDSIDDNDGDSDEDGIPDDVDDDDDNDGILDSEDEDDDGDGIMDVDELRSGGPPFGATASGTLVMLMMCMLVLLVRRRA